MRFGVWWGYVYAAGECTLIWPDKLELPEYPTIYITLNSYCRAQTFLPKTTFLYSWPRRFPNFAAC